jgi:hypothetical protein
LWHPGIIATLSSGRQCGEPSLQEVVMWQNIFQTYADAMQVAMLQSPLGADRRPRETRFVAGEQAGLFGVPLKQSKQVPPVLKSSSNS